MHSEKDEFTGLIKDIVLEGVLEGVLINQVVLVRYTIRHLNYVLGGRG